MWAAWDGYQKVRRSDGVASVCLTTDWSVCVWCMRYFWGLKASRSCLQTTTTILYWGWWHPKYRNRPVVPLQGGHLLRICSCKFLTAHFGVSAFSRASTESQHRHLFSREYLIHDMWNPYVDKVWSFFLFTSDKIKTLNTCYPSGGPKTLWSFEIRGPLLILHKASAE